MERIVARSNSSYNLDVRPKQQILVRSSGSFNNIEDIVVPTPSRKITTFLASPSAGRTHKRKNSEEEETIFGEAGLELQTILLQTVVKPRPAVEPLPISHVLVEAVPIRAVSPQRPSNPAILNFNIEDLQRSIKPVQEAIRLPTTRYHPAANPRTRGLTHSRKALNRARSLSWPGVPKNLAQTEVAAH